MWQELPFLKVTLGKVCLPYGLLRQGGEWRQGPRLELLFRGTAGAAVVLGLGYQSLECGDWLCLFNPSSFVGSSFGGRIAIGGRWPRAKIWAGAASWKPLPSGGVAVWASAAASASACGALEIHSSLSLRMEVYRLW